jgi:prevent-host-death family protein
MTEPESLPVEEARKKFADILDGTQFRSTHTEITRRGKAAGVVVPPEWYASITEEVEALRRKVEELSAAGKPQSALAAPRVGVSAVVPPKSGPIELDVEATTMEPLPELSPGKFRKAKGLAMSRAEPEQRERLNRTAQVARQLDRNENDEVLKAAFEMGLLKHDEVYADPEERPVGSEENTP